jgi:hypothetical protein
MFKVKATIASLTVIAFLATGMVFANTSATLPGTTPSANPVGWASTASYALPGVQSTQETPTSGVSQNGERPGIGVQSGERGSVYPNSSFLPGITAEPETLQSMKR